MSDDIRHLTLTVTLEPRDVLQIAQVLYESVRALRKTFGEYPPGWKLADIQQQHNAEVVVRRIAEGKIRQPSDIHDEWRDQAWRDGWRHPMDGGGPGPLADPRTNRFSPDICDWTELSPEAQCRYCLMFAVASTLLANVGMIVIARRAREGKPS